MDTTTQYLCLRTRDRRPALDEVVTRRLFIKTLAVLQAAGRLSVHAVKVGGTTAELLFSSAHARDRVVADIVGTTERVMLLACRTNGRLFWSRFHQCRVVSSLDDALGLQRLLERAEAGERAEETADMSPRWQLRLEPVTGAFPASVFL